MIEADIVVIEAGSGTAAVAGRLAEVPRHTVAVIEPGGDNSGWSTRMPGAMPFQTPATNWSYQTPPHPGLNGRRGYQPRGRGLGGSSAINAMHYVRGHPQDYDDWAALGCDRSSYADVLPWFRRAESTRRQVFGFRSIPTATARHRTASTVSGHARPGGTLDQRGSLSDAATQSCDADRQDGGAHRSGMAAHAASPACATGNAM